MCDPVTLTVATTALTIVGQGVSAYGQHQQANYQAQVSDINARRESARAGDALTRGRTEDTRYQRQAARERGQMRAALGANGIDPDSGSALDVQADHASFTAEDSATIRENAVREAAGFEVRAMNERAQASSFRQQGRAALIGGAFGMASTALGGAQQYDRLRSWKRGGY